jgi:hypothetical protein
MEAFEMILDNISNEKSSADDICDVNKENNSNNNMSPVSLKSHDVVYDKDPWLSSYITDQLYIEMCEKEIEDPHGQYGKKISKYYVEAAKYAGRISAGEFRNADGPIFLLGSKDFSPRLTAELADLYKTARETLDRVVRDAAFRIFKANHRRIFYQYIQSGQFRWRFV